MKNRWMHLIAGLTMCVLCISVSTTTVNADLVWEDNFDDENLDGWTIFGYENDTSPVEIGGNFSAASGILKVLDDDFNLARHESTTNVGTWSFDMFVPDVDVGFGWFYVDFMSNGSYNTEHGNISALSVGASFDDSRFYLLIGHRSSWSDIGSYRPDVFQGWHHIDASRTIDGQLLVYFNGTLLWDIVEQIIDSSTYLAVSSYNVTGAAIDNLVVDDTPIVLDPTTTPTTTTNGGTTPPPFDPLLIGLFGGIGVGVVIIAIVYLRRR